MGQFLKFCAYVLVMLAIVPLAGLCVTGSWRGAWRYAKDWARAILLTFTVAAIIWLVIQPFTPQ